MKLNYWKIINQCNWGMDFDCDRIKDFLINYYTKSERRELHDFCRKKIKKLYRTFEKYSLEKFGDKYSNFYVSDDGMSDLTAHIVGLGEEEYNKVIKNPELARKRAKNREYKENFMYSFHFDDFEEFK